MPTADTLLLALIPLAYLLGSIPFGLLVGLSKGVDPRTAGSGNIGATNVGRLLGARYFGYVFTLDMLKAALPTAAGSAIALHYAASGYTLTLQLLVGFAAIFGHMCSIFLKFKGGKGVASGAGVALGLFPYFTLPGLAALAVWALIYALTRYVSLASILAAVAFPLLYLAFGLWRAWPVFTARMLPLLIFASLVAVMVLVRHRSNIQRLRSGTESKFTGKASQGCP
jgi:glycerol-3-phosphate acyltransferase PlsY